MWRFPRLARMSSRRSSQPSRRPLFRPTVEALEARRVMTSLLPTPGDDSYSTPMNTILQVAAPGVMVNDTPTPDLVPVILTQPAHGGVSLGTDGRLTYRPHFNFCGTDSFTYQFTDGFSFSEPAVVTLNVTCVNDRPAAAGDSYDMTENGVLTVGAPGILANDHDPDGDVLSAVLIGDVAHGTLELNPDGGFTYTPTTGFSGTDSFTYRAQDGVSSSEDTTVTIQVLRPIVQEIKIDVGPALNLHSKRVIAVKVYSTADFDATRIDIESLLLAGAPAVRSAEDDLNGDGLPDLVVHVRVQDSALFALYDGSLDSELKQTVEISLTCETVDDVMLEGLESLDILLAGKYRRELLYDLAASGAV